MVSRHQRRSWLLWVVVVAGLGVTSPAKDLAEYRLGDPILEDVITPAPLMVVDPVATKALKDKEADRIPVIFRYNETALATVDASLREVFAQARNDFLRLVEEVFHRAELNARQMESEQFLRVLATFKRHNPAFPLSEEMAREWAGGNVALPEQIACSARVHQAMQSFIRSDNSDDLPKLGNQVLLVPVKGEHETITFEDAKTRGYVEPRTNVLTLSEARQALRELFAANEADLASFANRWLRENCFGESELTLTTRARFAAPLFAADNYQAGQVIARQGQLVNAKILAAFSQLQDRALTERLATAVAKEREKVTHEQARAAQIQARNQWLLIGLLTVGGALALVLLMPARRHRPASDPQPLLGGTKAVPLLGASAPEAATATDAWQQRALAAEQQIEQAHAAIRAGVMAQLKEKLVSSLAVQRGELLAAQQSAADEMAELEQRLNELHAPLQERLRVYEARIAELEKALVAKGEENRGLIKTKIEMMRKQLEAERSKTDLVFS